MMTGPSVGPGMLLTVLMRWPALITVLAIGGTITYLYKEYGLPDNVESALHQWHGKSTLKIEGSMISDSDKSKVIDDLSAMPVRIAASSAEAAASVSPPQVIEKKEIEQVVVEKYLVLNGDNLFRIASKRSTSVAIQKMLMNNIFVDNPNAFKDSDPNQLLANVEIIIRLK